MPFGENECVSDRARFNEPLICVLPLRSLASENQGDESLGAVAYRLNFLTSLSLFLHGLREIMIPALHKFIVRKK